MIAERPLTCVSNCKEPFHKCQRTLLVRYHSPDSQYAIKRSKSKRGRKERVAGLEIGLL